MPRSTVNRNAPAGHVTAKVAADMLGVTTMTIHRLWQRGQLKKYRAAEGRNVYYRISEINALKNGRYRGELVAVPPKAAE